MARTTGGDYIDNTGRTGGSGTGGSGTGGSGTGGTGGGSSGGSSGVSYVRDESKTENGTWGLNPGIPPASVEITLADGQYYGTFTDKAVAEQNQTYFAYFDGIGGTGPEIIDQTAYFIKYIIDTKGNVVDPAPFFGTSRDQEAGLFNLIDNFEVGKRAIIKQIEYDPTQATYKNLSGVHTITGVGFMENIAVTEIGISPNDYTPTMSFDFDPIPYSVGNMDFFSKWFPGSNTNQNGRVEVPNFLDNPDLVGIFFGDPQYQFLRVPFTEVISNSGNGWELLTDSANVGKFKALSGSAETRTRIRFQASIATAVDVSGYLCKISINKNGIKIFESNNIAVPSLAQTSSPGYRTFTSDWYQDYLENDIFEVEIVMTQYGSYEDLAIGGPFIFASDEGNGASGNFIRIEQETPPNATGGDFPDVIIGKNTAYAPYFTGSYNVTSSYSASGIVNPNASYTLLVLSQQLSSVFKYNALQTINTASQSGVDGMNFSKCTIPFGNVQPGDYIRFEYNKNNVFRIVGVDFWSNFTTGSTGFGSLNPTLWGDQYIVWKISPPLGTSPKGTAMQLNHFNIYRIVNNGSYIILDVPRTDPNSQTGTFTSGILQPEFSSEDLVNDYNKIITTLTEKETIN
jgi:hypothetical protein